MVNVNENIECVFFRDSDGSEQAMNLFWVHEQYLQKAKEKETAGDEEEAKLNYNENEFGDDYLAAEMDDDEVEDDDEEAEGGGDNADD